MCRCQQPTAVGFGLVQGEIGAGLPGTAAGSEGVRLEVSEGQDLRGFKVLQQF